MSVYIKLNKITGVDKFLQKYFADKIIALLRPAIFSILYSLLQDNEN